ncbi:hypothetical protein [Fuchsiella alkaliacetigena]|uniref:hypothetical protein n=1 Tax=Fuchsiella alkaliacetigena TaxID=957042 RepID=UPI00200AEDD6|nr:hypothetical protein [Fuchsiella alkaliacetigena]MCK8825262.1 hypothetical protein [Fuchsiella alkaliacetigena]
MQKDRETLAKKAFESELFSFAPAVTKDVEWALAIENEEARLGVSILIDLPEFNGKELVYLSEEEIEEIMQEKIKENIEIIASDQEIVNKIKERN